MSELPSKDVVNEAQPKRSYAGLFRFYDHSDLVILVPALVTSIASGFQIPAFTVLLGKLFSSFSDFSNGALTGDELQRQATLFVIGICIVGAAAWALGWSNMSLWLAFGEGVAKKARHAVLKGLMEKDMTWYDTKVVKTGISGSMNKAVKYFPKCQN
jgi:hypothetical protein